MIITKEQIKLISPYTSEQRIDYILPLLNETIALYEINTPLRVQHYLSQVLHESGGFRYLEEIASGQAYENRRDLGNIIAGDGKRFKGRGLIQLTGRANYDKYGKYKKQDFIGNPNLVATKYAVDVSGWFWTIEKSLNIYADKDDIITITKKINGGLNGLEDRKKYLELAKKYIK